MADSTITPQSMSDTAAGLSPRIALAAFPAGGLLASAFAVSDPLIARLLFGAGMTLVFVIAISHFLAFRRKRAQAALGDALGKFVEHDNAPAFLTDGEGQIRYRNTAAKDRFDDRAEETLAQTLRDHFANPSAVVYRLQTRAEAQGAAREDIVTRRGHIRLSVHQVSENEFLWRLEDMGLRNINSRGAETLSLPMLTASKSGTVLFMNEAMRTLLGGRVKTLDRIFNELPVKSGQENEIAAADGPVRTLVAELEGPGGRREIYLLPGGEGGLSHDGSWQFFDHLPVPMLKIAPDGRVLLGNRGARTLLNYQEDPGGDPVYLSDLVEGLGRPIGDWLREAAGGRGLNRSEVLQARRPESEVFLQFSLSRVVEEGGPVLIAVLNDATELKTLEAQFVQSQKMQAIGQLAGGVAHDFNNLLTAISGHCDLLLLRHQQGDMDYADLMQIHQNANRAASLVGQLLAFSRKQNLRPEVLDLRETLSELTHLLNRLVGEKVTLSFSHDPGLQPILADKRQLEQVLMNLVVNARDAMPEGGEVRIETFDTTLAEPLQRDRATVPAGDYVVVKVSDQGVGIPSDKLNKVFEPFYTTKRTGEGTGLGLSTAYGIVKQTGGFIFVDSVAGNGTCFTLYFPAHGEGQLAAPQKDKARREVSGDDLPVAEETGDAVLPDASPAATGNDHTPAAGMAAEPAVGEEGHPPGDGLPPGEAKMPDPAGTNMSGMTGGHEKAAESPESDPLEGDVVREADVSSPQPSPAGEGISREAPPLLLTADMGGGSGTCAGQGREPGEDDPVGRLVRSLEGGSQSSEPPPETTVPEECDRASADIPVRDVNDVCVPDATGGSVLQAMSFSSCRLSVRPADRQEHGQENGGKAGHEEEQSVRGPFRADPSDSPGLNAVRGEGVVLLVEDEAPVRAFASRALRMRGYTVLEAECAEEALRILEQTDLAVDIFVTDVIMPGMDGPSWVRKALKDRPGVKVVFVSGYAEEDFSEHQARIPNSVFLPKPFSLNELTSTVQKQLH